ncbi:MAG: hypothetical protein L0Z73_01185, partial [Gammaproteobacteria bacterium]|nr:hypothetical protein [Gammaproteobacteria bacterium]
MNGNGKYIYEKWVRYPIQQFALLLAVMLAPLYSLNSFAQVPVITVEGSTATNTTEAVAAYRWLIEEDAMHHIEPGVTCRDSTQLSECLSVDFHRSYMPVVAEGNSGDPLPDLDETKRYHVTILPNAEYTLGGAQIAPGQVNVTVRVNQQPIPTAQIRVFVFHDNAPIDNEPDQPQEVGLAGFSLLLEDAGGRYGDSGQVIRTDAYGNPLGTTYNPDGSVLTPGDGTITTDANGYAVIKNIAPGKYGIIAAPPPADPNWIQTSTIEGKKVVDAWVKANEPAYFAEFGPPGPHVFIGFVKQFSDASALSGGATISGQIRSIHNSRPPDFTFFTGAPVPGCWVGLNEMIGGVAGRGLFAGPCNGDSTFSIPNVPAGSYSLSIWDENLDYIFAQLAVTVDAVNGVPQNVDLLDVPVFAWFHRLEQYVFNDVNENGVWDEGETGMPEVGTAIRWRDGTIYQEFPTDTTGTAPYDEVFPFFSWLVAEVAFDRFKATGVTVRVDDGGPLADGEVQNPQPQSENAGAGYRVETGPVLTQAFQGFLGQTNILEWGKTFYLPGENGGISGIVYYAVTRAEDDPQYAAPELWEPGIPRIQVALYEDFNNDGVIDDQNGNGAADVADVDNHPFGNFPGAEDFDYNLNGINDPGDAIQVTTTDSWDDNLPAGCQGDPFVVDGTPIDCYDGLRNFNQVRAGVFDGGYAFSDIPVGAYIVGAGDHPAYRTVKEEDRNVDFGDTFDPVPNLLPPVCVGQSDPPHVVPDTFSLFDNGEAPYRAGEITPLCNLKQIILSDGRNAAADFFLFTYVPIAAHVVGFILDDVSNEFDFNSPQFGEKYSPPYMPVSIRDWKGHEIGRTYSDRWGRFNVLLPSTYTANLPTSSGMSPGMITTCMNDPGPIPDGAGGFVTDPYFQRQYSQFCYTFQYMPGATTYLDTPVLPVAAFAGPDQFALDCEYPSGTPVIWSATSAGFAGPYVAAAGDILTITSVGTVPVPNPYYGAPGEPQSIERDFGFGGTEGTVSFNGVPVDP